MAINVPYISSTQVASSVPFDNSTNGYVATDVQAAIVESSVHLTATEVSATAAANTSSGTDALITSMTSTPVAGTYLVWFSCDLNSPTGGAVVSVSYYVGGAQNATSLRKVMPFAGGTLTAGSQRMGIALNALLTVNGSQAIEVRWSTSAGTISTAARAMNLLRVL